MPKSFDGLVAPRAALHILPSIAFNPIYISLIIFSIDSH